MLNGLERVILNAVEGRFSKGDSFRMRHAKDGDKICTPKDKDPAMTVTRISNGWVYHCHRCHTSGHIDDAALNPIQTRKRVDAVNDTRINSVTENVTLPFDFMPMTEEENCPVPYTAWHWFWKYSLTDQDIAKFNCGWSERYNRVIIPLYEYIYSVGDVARKLVGWVGREIECQSKEERKRRGVVKYLTRAKKGKRRFFVAPGEDTVVIVEDAISAMKVNLATGFTTIALLNTFVNNDLMRTLRGKVIYLWLDGDMLANSVQTVQRMRTLGLDAKHIHTPKDPKEYNSLFIRETIREKNICTLSKV
jgi:hypothetical protein